MILTVIWWTGFCLSSPSVVLSGVRRESLLLQGDDGSQGRAVALSAIARQATRYYVVYGVCAAFGYRNNMIDSELVANISVAIRAVIFKVLQYSQPLFLREFKGDTCSASASICIVEPDIVAVPRKASRAQFVVVFQRWVRHTASLAWAAVFGSWLQRASAKNNALVTGRTHAPGEAAIAGCGTAANSAWTKLSPDRGWLEATLSSLLFPVAVVAQFFLVILLNLTAPRAWTRKPCFCHLESPCDLLLSGNTDSSIYTINAGLSQIYSGGN